MGLDVEVPDPPALPEARDPNEYPGVADVAGDGDYRRGELEGFLDDGAWKEAFNEWAEHTDLTEEEFAAARDLGLLRGFDFFWDGAAEEVGFRTPEVPDDWRERPVADRLDRGTVSAIDAAMSDLGRTVSEMLEERYVDFADEEPPEWEQQWGSADFEEG